MLVVGRLDIGEDAWVELMGDPPDPWNFDGWLGELRPRGPVVAPTRSEMLKALRALPDDAALLLSFGKYRQLWLGPTALEQRLFGPAQRG